MCLIDTLRWFIYVLQSFHIFWSWWLALCCSAIIQQQSLQANRTGEGGGKMSFKSWKAAFTSSPVDTISLALLARITCWREMYEAVLFRSDTIDCYCFMKLLSLQPNCKASYHTFWIMFVAQLEEGSITYREWVPNAKQVFLIGDFNKWKIPHL